MALEIFLVCVPLLERYHAQVITNTSSFERIWLRIRGQNTLSNAVIAFVQLMEKRFGARFVYDYSQFPFGPELADLSELAAQLKQHGIIKRVSKVPSLPDEPPLYQWSVENNTTIPHTTGGLSFESERSALTAALAESLERYIWFETNDYFEGQRTATVKTIGPGGIHPSVFAGFSPEQRASDEKLILNDTANFLWTKGVSWTKGRDVWLPAQIVSAFEARRKSNTEPLIRPSITTGLATWTNRAGAVVRGALEVIERDAFMIMWLNQLSLPVLSVDSLRARHPTFNTLLHTCEQYRLRTHFVQLITDAPAYVVCAVVEDESAEGPPITVGTKAHGSLVEAAESALLEALRARSNVRKRRHIHTHKSSASTSFRQNQRPQYWSEEDRHKRLAFLTAGQRIQVPEAGAWERDTDEEHLHRIVEWCKAKKYDLISVNMGKSKRNPLPWKIEMVVIPQLQPLHQDERYACIYGARLQDIPKQFGFTPRAKPFTAEPHPFT